MTVGGYRLAHSHSYTSYSHDGCLYSLYIRPAGNSAVLRLGFFGGLTLWYLYTGMSFAVYGIHGHTMFTLVYTLV